MEEPYCFIFWRKSDFQNGVLISNGEKCDKKWFSVIQNGRREPFCEKKKKKLCIYLKWPEMRSKVIFGYPKSVSLFAPIHMKSWPKVKLGQSYYLIQFVFFYPYLAPKYIFCPYLALLAYIYHYLPIFGLFRLNYPYLGIFALNCPDFTICAIFNLCNVFFYWDCTSVHNFRAIGPLFMEILHFEDLGLYKSVINECSLGLVIDNFFM